MFNQLSLAVAVCFIAGGAHGQGTAVVTNTFDTATCTGTLICTITDTTSGTQTIDGILNVNTAKLKFIKGGTTIYELTRASADGTIAVKSLGGTTTYTGITATENDAQEATLTFVSSFPISSALVGDWTCDTEDSGSDAALIYSAGAAKAIAHSDLGSCTTTVTLDSCAQTLTCDLGTSVAAVQTDGGVIKFQKDGSDEYQIAAADDAVTSDGTNAVTGATASAPVGTSGTDANKATVTIGSTGTWDTSTIDGDWTCTVTTATKASYALASASLSANSICTTISMDACAKTMTCDLGVSAATVQTQSGTISFKRAGTTIFQIAASDDAVTSDGTTAVTGVTAAAPASTATADANKATLTFDATATFDSTLDGSWTCEVTGATDPNNVISASTTLSTTCGAEMNKVAGLLVALMVAIKVLLF